MFMTSCAWNCYLNYLTLSLREQFQAKPRYKRNGIMNVCLEINEFLSACLANFARFSVRL